jgi:hypothetical protein
MIPTSGNEILVDPPELAAKAVTVQPGQELVTWVMGKVGPWESAPRTRLCPQVGRILAHVARTVV